MTTTSADRRVRQGRVLLVIIVLTAAFNALMLAVNVAAGSLAALLSAAAIIACVVMMVKQVRLVGNAKRARDLARHAGPQQVTPGMGTRERTLRRLASRPRRVMTPDDYKRLGELEEELGWEPSEAPESLASGGVVALEPREVPACHCGKSAEEHAREWDEQVIASQGIPPARLADGEVKDATEAAQHFAQLARVGREFCVSYCPICSHRIHEIASGIRGRPDQDRRCLETERRDGNES